MTEDEAKTKVCCGPLNANNSDTLARCIGSACMAWRQIVATIEIKTFEEMGGAPGSGWHCTLSDTGRERFLIKSAWQRDIPPHGYCGLAGKP